MGLDIRFTARSVAHLSNIRARIATDRPLAAEFVRGRILQTIELLGTLPHLGRTGRRQGTRELVVAGLPYVVVYRIDIGDADEIVILAVRHHRTNT